MTEKKTVRARRITESDDIQVGTVLYDKVPGFGAQRAVVTRVTPKYIFIGEAKFRRDGTLVSDEWRRARLHIAV